ncbi:OmpA family protein [Carboxylicivirga sp. A043]|uniref:OmpA family protein n=1 Tax=Carboxylicivirga litoralis TaxID=2816963 RepID=UPI0021CB1735|nr:OmpA family protein [Carboxylicivirga sp. A043]MCU4154797.1 OmpA family protein [Carboxylicivirga sp. A043]
MDKHPFKAILFLALMCCTTIMQAQFTTDHRQLEEHQRYSKEKKFNTWSIAFGYGPMIMQNDLTSYAVLPDKHWKLGPMIKVDKQIHPAWALDFMVMSSDFHVGNETYYNTGNIIDYSVGIITYINQWFAYPGPMNDKWNLYLKLGVGMASFRTRVHYTETGEVATNRAGTSYLVLGYSQDDPYKETARANEIVTPLSLGLQRRINRSFDIAFETSMRWSIEDKLDYILLGANNDKYWYTNIHLVYKIGKKNKRHSRWTHRGYGFNVFDKPKKDPLADEVAELQEQLRQYESKRVIKIDSVKVKHHASRIYGSNNMVSIYFDSYESELDTKDQVDLATIGLYMTKNPRSTVDIYGYNDSRDSSEENLEISKNRCEAVLSYFVDDLGIDKNRFTLIPKGEDDLLLPKNKEKSSAIRMINRRADVVIFKP